MAERRVRFLLCDVFTSERFGGNPLAVLPDATGLCAAEMQRIAREFNFSESSFVTAGDDGCDRRVRIFTPTVEVPFAGHPNVGTAFALEGDGQFGEPQESREVVFDEAAGRVRVEINRDDQGRIFCELEAPQRLSTGAMIDAAQAAAALSLREEDIVVTTHPPIVGSVGLPFLLVEVVDRAALARARAVIAELEALRDAGIVPDLHVYCRSDDEFDIRARMFAPLDGVPEDPATGSANCALAALLASRAAGGDGERRLRIAQGVEMGRPSLLAARTRRDGDDVTVWIGGHSVLVGEGSLVLD